jgi:hypothetical protein
MAFPATIEQKIIAFSQSTRPTDMAPYLVGQIKARYLTVKTLLEYAQTKQCENSAVFIINTDILCKLGDLFLKEKDEKLKKQSVAFYQLAADRWSIEENFKRAKSEFYVSNQNILLALTCANKVIKLAGNRSRGYAATAHEIKACCHEKLGEWSQARKTRFQDTFIPNTRVEIAVKERAQLLKSQIIDEHASATKVVPKPSNSFFNPPKKKCSNETAWFNSINPKEHVNFSEEEENMSRRYAAENHFFNPSRSSKLKKLQALGLKIIDARFEESDDVVPIGDNARQMISVENMFQRATRALTDDTDLKLGMPVSRKRLRELGTKTYGPVERYQVGETTVELQHRADLSRNRFNLYILDLGTYEALYRTLILKLTSGDAEKEKQLAAFMIRYGKLHQGISLEELLAMNTSSTIDDVKKFNRLCFLMLDKEQGQWLSAPDKKYHLGLSVSQARCLILLKEGMICFKDVFSKNPPMGVYSSSNLISDEGRNAVVAACQRIDDLYLTYLQKNKYSTDYAAFIKKYADQPARKCLLRTAHQDLKTVYGGDSDTDGEGYNSDMSLSYDKLK